MNRKYDNLKSVFAEKEAEEKSQKKNEEEITEEKELPVPQNKTAAPHNYLVYKVKEGDSLVSIINQFPGLSLKELVKHNEGLDANSLTAGKELKIIQYD